MDVHSQRIQGSDMALNSVKLPTHGASTVIALTSHIVEIHSKLHQAVDDDLCQAFSEDVSDQDKL